MQLKQLQKESPKQIQAESLLADNLPTTGLRVQWFFTGTASVSLLDQSVNSHVGLDVSKIGTPSLTSLISQKV